ncbi:MAG: DUF1902 domain-containing protein [Rhizobiales bacterium]|nr:DUF1902 domain-containing protein [Hyphomicrobiales bacterium]
MTLAYLTLRPDAEAEAVSEYPVSLYLAPEADMWIAESDALPIATEAATLDALIERVWEIAPEIAELNGHRCKLNLRFEKKRASTNLSPSWPGLTRPSMP